MGSEYLKAVRECNESLDTYNNNVKECASVSASYKYANDNYDGSLGSWSSKQREGESKARDCFK